MTFDTFKYLINDSTMKNTILFFICISLSIISYSQEMETSIFNLTDIILDLSPDSLNGGNSEINLQRIGNYNDAIINFKYRDVPYEFEPNLAGGFSEWQVGVLDEPDTSGDFSINNYALYYDLVLRRRDFVIREDNGYVGIGTFSRPTANLEIKHFSTLANEPALIIGNTCEDCAYTNVNKPKLDATTGIAQWTDYNTWAARINDNGSFYRFSVNGHVYSSTGGFYGPIIILSKKKSNNKNILKKLSSLELVSGKNKSLKNVYALEAMTLQKSFPELVQTVEKDPSKLIAANYVGLVPILVGAHQEISKELTEAKLEIKKLNERLSKLEALLK